MKKHIKREELENKLIQLIKKLPTELIDLIYKFLLCFIKDKE